MAGLYQLYRAASLEYLKLRDGAINDALLSSHRYAARESKHSPGPMR